MKRVMITGGFLVAMIAVPTFVRANDTATGVLTVTGTVASSISLSVETGTGTENATITSNGTDAASTDLGTTFSKYGSIPSGWARSQGASSWTLSSNFGVKVQKANSASDGYTLVANLGTDPQTVGWNAGGAFVAVAAHNLTSTGTYGTTANYAWSIVIPDNLTTPDLANTIHFLATAN